MMNKQYSTHNLSHNQPKDEEIDLKELLLTLTHHKLAIFLSMILGLVISLIYIFVVSPTYQASALLQIDSNGNSNVLESIMNINSDFGGSNSPTADTQIELIQSRAVLGATVHQLHLDIQVAPKYNSFLDKINHHIFSKNTNNILDIANFTTPSDNTPDQDYYIRIEPNQNFTFWTDNQAPIKGHIGTLLTTSNGYTILIQSAPTTAVGQEFIIQKKPFLDTIRDIRKQLGITESGIKTGILSLTYNDKNPQQAQAILHSIISNYLLRNREQQEQNAQSGINFINEQLPRIKASLDKAEDELSNYRNKHNSIDVSVEAKGILDNLAQIEQQITQIKAKEAQVLELFTSKHPSYISLDNQRRVLERSRADLMARIGHLPQTQQSIVRMTRDINIQQNIYLQLLNKLQELGIQKASSLSNVRIIDDALTSLKPIKPNKPLIVLGSTVSFGVLAMLIILAKSLLHHGIQDVEELELVGVPVLATIPFSDKQYKRETTLAKLRKNTPSTKLSSQFILASDDPSDIAVEAIRGLRTHLYFTMEEAKNNVIMISGATPNAGKSFVSVNLSVILAQAGKKVLLVDADMRKGYLHELFKLNLQQGLAQLLTGETTIDQTIIHTTIPLLDFMCQGKNATNPSELLLSQRFPKVLEQLSAQYDYVILDAPPILAVTDAAIIGQLAGTSLMVVRFGDNTMSEIENSLSRFINSHITIKGTILNGFKKTAHTTDRYMRYMKSYNHYK